MPPAANNISMSNVLIPVPSVLSESVEVEGGGGIDGGGDGGEGSPGGGGIEGGGEGGEGSPGGGGLGEGGFGGAPISFHALGGPSRWPSYFACHAVASVKILMDVMTCPSFQPVISASKAVAP